jgi:hypothetical protein
MYKDRNPGRVLHTVIAKKDSSAREDVTFFLSSFPS